MFLLRLPLCLDAFGWSHPKGGAKSQSIDCTNHLVRGGVALLSKEPYHLSCAIKASSNKPHSALP